MDLPDIRTVVKKPITLQLNVRTYLKDDVYIARCDELKISDQGQGGGRG